MDSPRVGGPCLNGSLLVTVIQQSKLGPDCWKLSCLESSTQYQYGYRNAEVGVKQGVKSRSEFRQA